ncbi:MAG: RNA-binding S4 domain-containing protein [Oscillospiraceae bacterium]
MRLDKFLKVSRIIKRRTVANEVCDAARVCVNGRQARASYPVKEDDIIELTMGTRPIKARVLSVEDNVKKDASREMYEVIGE